MKQEIDVHLSELVDRRLSRRAMLGGMGAGALMMATPGFSTPSSAARPFRFTEIAHGVDATHHVAPGHEVDILLRWGDPVLPGAPAWNPGAQTGAAQAGQFGYNCDFVGLIPAGAERLMLGVNHEYVNPELMHPDIFGEDGTIAPARYSQRHAEVEMAAVGISLVELRRNGPRWEPVIGPRNRRVSMLESPVAVGGPAAGHARMRTSADPKGQRINGTQSNCAGGVTPWGTYLTAEENIQFAFSGALPEGHSEQANHRRMLVLPADGSAIAGVNRLSWARFDPRFDLAREPNEPNRHGWIVEVDALDPSAPAVKRTALGRFAHEGAETIVNGDGRLVVYMGDDARNEYLYRFVSRDRVSPDRARNRDLLDHGTLSVAVFCETALEWRPLVFGEGPLTPANGFRNQGDVVIEARRAAELLGATPMDRPEDVEAHPTNGRVYLMLTNNSSRTQVDAPNPRAANRDGQILELVAPGGDHAAERFGWEMLVLCGNPADAAVGARWNPATSSNGWFSCPDNCAFDPEGRLWIATDQGRAWARTATADGLWALETDGAERGRGRMFFRVPVGAEMCGPRFTADGRHLFLAVQHPAADGVQDWPEFGRPSTYHDPATRWPDFRPDLPPRPSVVVVRRTDGGPVGG
ncbi:MAG: PhoX family protein [Thermaurantiacus sp.]